MKLYQNLHVLGREQKHRRLENTLHQENTKDIISQIGLSQWDKYFLTLLAKERAQYQRTRASPLRINFKEVKQIRQTLKYKSPQVPVIFRSIKTAFTKKYIVQLHIRKEEKMIMMKIIIEKSQSFGSLRESKKKF